ncbi:MAG TPA: molybdate ABC transporter substrate-binding protein [Kiritimatiellia bacterium]|nr:molybdate ABC transporter substrate-binding protein [Kiritimatiellia bacterium]
MSLAAGMLALGVAGCSPRRAAEPDRLFVAASSDLAVALPALIEGFREKHPEWPVDVMYEAAGLLHRQLLNRAPFDLFLSSNTEFPYQLVAEGKGAEEDVFVYGRGRLVVMARVDSPLDFAERGIHALDDPRAVRIAVADPRVSPYGVAAFAALLTAELLEAVEADLVLADNVAEAAARVADGSMSAGLVAGSLAGSGSARDAVVTVEISPEIGPPLEQAGVILRWARNRDAAEAFRDYLLGPEGQRILSEHGYWAAGE